MSYAALNTEAIHPGVRPHTGPGLGFVPSPWRFGLSGMGAERRNETLGAERRNEFLGDVSQELIDGALALGMDQHTLDTLVALGATDADFADLVQGNIDVVGLMQRLTGGAPVVDTSVIQPVTDNPVFAAIESQLAAADQEITAAESALASVTGADPNAQVAAINDVTAARAQWNDYNSQYQEILQAANQPGAGMLPDGSIAQVTMAGTGLGSAGYVILIAAGIITALYSGIVIWRSQTTSRLAAETANLQARTQSSAVTQGTVLTQQANAADAAGNHTLATQLRAQAAAVLTAGTPAGSVSGPKNWSLWLQQNAIVIGAVFAAIIIVPKVLKKI
jgi:hypothetical protein